MVVDTQNLTFQGDEAKLGDPIEDAVSIGACSLITTVKHKLLVCVGLGCDRFMGVSDCSSLRAVAELTALGGFLGCSFVDSCVVFYRSLIEFINKRQEFRSVIAASILASSVGDFGNNVIDNAPRVFVWPLMSMFFVFDVTIVARRSLIVGWLTNCKSVPELYAAKSEGRARITKRNFESLPKE